MTHSPIENNLKPGWYLYWQNHIYQILSFIPDNLTIQVKHLQTQQHHDLHLQTLLLDISDAQDAPIFAPSLPALQSKIARQAPAQTIAPASDLPQNLLTRADTIIRVVQFVEQQVAEYSRQAMLHGEQVHRTQEIKTALAQLDQPLSLPTYYRYLRCYRQHNGDRGSIAASFRRSTFNQSALSDAQTHFIDTLILRFYARKPPIRPSTLYKIAAATLKHTASYWIDPNKCGSELPLDIIAELLNPDIPIALLLNNSEKRGLLTHITLPSRSWLYGYLRWFEQQPDRGQQVITSRYGYETWEREQQLFDTFVTRATLPLQYVFADHWLLDVFILDDATRSQPIRLWLTLLLDAYSRSILGMALLHEAPCIESIQQALSHALWPKTSHQELDLEGEWICYGIPQQLSLDNAWAHHSHSLENLARVISQEGQYNSIDLVFRPPYKGRYGALIERFFGNLSNRVQELLPGAISSSHPRALRQAAQQACFLYQDIYRILHQIILTYQHTPHSELDGMTPHEKWLHGMQWSLAHVPPQTPDIQRLFWRLSPDTRVITSKGIHAFGLTYWAPHLQHAPRVNTNGQRLRYRFRYDPADISRIALFHQGKWWGDLAAKELRRPDGSLRPISLWERQLALQLAHDNQRSHARWLHFVTEIEALGKQRLREKKRVQRPTPTTPQPPQIMDECLLVPDYQDYTNLLARFMDSQEDGS